VSVMGSFSGKMELETTAAATDNVAQCCRYGHCCHHGSPLAIRGKRLSPKLKPNHEKRSVMRNVPTKDDDRAKLGESASIQCGLVV